MAIKEEILLKQELRLQILTKIYDEVDGNMENSLSEFETIEELFPTTDKAVLKGILRYFFQKKYINYIDVSDMEGFNCISIRITSKGIELIEGIATDGNVSKFEVDFSKSILNVSFSGNVSNSNVAIGNGNSQTISISNKDNASILKFIEKLIEENPNKVELVDAKEAVIEQKNKGELSKSFLKVIGAISKQFATDVTVNLLTTGAIHMLGL